MFGQTFDLTDIPRVGALALLEIFLSADNAIVLGVLAHALPEKLRVKALYIGLISAFFLRAGALLIVSFLLRYPWLQLLGGAYLIFLSVQQLLKKRKQPEFPSPTSFWKTVLLIELFDLAFAVDSIVAGVAFIASKEPSPNYFHPKLWIVYVGGMIGLGGIRYAADLFSRLMLRFPRLELSAYLLVGWIGLKLLIVSQQPDLPLLEPIFWIGFLLLLLTPSLTNPKLR
jgi:YkoY family integral membrane protein